MRDLAPAERTRPVVEYGDARRVGHEAETSAPPAAIQAEAAPPRGSALWRGTGEG
jgi:hypothetical protein